MLTMINFFPHTKSMTLILSIIVLFIIGAVAYYFWYSSAPSYTILETRTFSCPGMEGFTFEYPVFEGWEYSETDPKTCGLSLSKGGYTYLKVQVLPDHDEELPTTLLGTNPHGLHYLAYADKIQFSLGNDANPSRILIKLMSLPVKENRSDITGFSRDAFWKTVIESFRVVGKTNQ